MIRKVAILILFLAGVAAGTLCLISLSIELPYTHRVRPYHNGPLAWQYSWNAEVREIPGAWRQRQNEVVIACEAGRGKLMYWRWIHKTDKHILWHKKAPGLFHLAFQASTVAPGELEHRYQLWCLSIHLWIISLLLLAYPAIAFIRGPYRRHRRRKKGLCLKCGYNLTGNTSGVCPECGERI